MRLRHPRGEPPRETVGLRITVVGINYTPELTGIGPYTAAIAAGLRQRGHHPTVLTGLPHYPQWRIAPGYRSGRRFAETVDGVDVTRLRHHVPIRSSTVARLRMELSFTRSVVRQGLRRPDLLLIISPPLITCAALVAIAALRRLPVGLVVQDIYSRGAIETGALTGLPARVLRAVERRTISRATGTVVVHDRFVETLTGLGVDRRLLTVIRNWVRVTVPDGVDRAAVRARLGWADDEVIVIHSGNIGVKQGLENVVHAARLADAAGDHIRFVLIGDGNRRRAIEELAEGVASIEFLRPLPEREFLQTLGAADVLLVNERPGVAEMAAPSKLTTYFATGRPILAAADPTGVTAEEIRFSGAGVLVPAGHPKQLLDGALELARDSATANTLGASGHRYSDDTLDEDTALDHYAAWCAALVAGYRR